jgi:hypothetical protein
MGKEVGEAESRHVAHQAVFDGHDLNGVRAIDTNRFIQAISAKAGLGVSPYRRRPWASPANVAAETKA